MPHSCAPEPLPDLVDLLPHNAGKLICDETGTGLHIAHRTRHEPVPILPGQSCYFPAWIGLSPGARNRICAAQGGDLIHASGSKTSAHWQSCRGPRARHLERRRAQYRAFDDDTARLHWIRGLIAMKLDGQIDILRSWWRRHPTLAWQGLLRRLTTARRHLLAGARSSEQLRSLEGEGAAVYFTAWRELLADPDFRRRPRERRCPINLLADLYYAHLTSLLDAHCRAAGYDSHYGALHPPRNSRPSLALDLIEPLRPRIVDRLLLTIAAQAQPATWMQRDPEGRWTFTAPGRRKALGRWKTWYYGGTRRPGQKRWLAHILQIWQDWLQHPHHPPRPW